MIACRVGIIFPNYIFGAICILSTDFLLQP